MNRSCKLILGCFLAGLGLNASAQQSTPAAFRAGSAGGDTRGASRLACGKEPRRRGHCGPPGRFAL